MHVERALLMCPWAAGYHTMPTVFLGHTNLKVVTLLRDHRSHRATLGHSLLRGPLSGIALEDLQEMAPH